MTNETEARDRDAADPGHRDLFHVPPATGGPYDEVAYFAGNSLGLQPKVPRVPDRAGRPAGRCAAG